jgi:cytochrome c oxidase accessory protein FixG
LFANRRKVYPKSVDGPVRRIKWAVLTACLAIYYAAPWLRWDRGPGRPDQALLIDMPGRRAYFFGLEIWPQEIYYLAGLLILGAVALFFVTSLFGRLWCGFTCPQTAWTDLFMWTERLIEGDRGARIRLDQAPLSWRKAAKKVAKHAAWLLIAAATGGAWIMYYNDAPSVTRAIFTGTASYTVYGFVGLFTATTYLLAGWAREQVCTYMCPWPRIQSAMVDERTLTVTYRDWRGEPRSPLRKETGFTGRGDCIDCAACVHACPTGIDIRDGLQLECIGCGLCIDACNEVMSRVGRPRNLIAFDTPANRAAELRGEKAPLRLLRPRNFIYGAVLLAAAGAMAAALMLRHSATLAVLPERAVLYVTLSDGEIRNAYTLRIENHDPAERRFVLTAAGVPGAMLHVEGPGEPAPAVPAEGGIAVVVKGDGVGTFRAFVHAPRPGVAETPLSFVVRPDGGSETARYATTFRAPRP